MITLALILFVIGFVAMTLECMVVAMAFYGFAVFLLAHG